jgi:hypothetical protein
MHATGTDFGIKVQMLLSARGTLLERGELTC